MPTGSWIGTTIVGYCPFRASCKNYHSGAESKGHSEQVENYFIAYKTRMQSRWPPKSHSACKCSALINCNRLCEGCISFSCVFLESPQCLAGHWAKVWKLKSCGWNELNSKHRHKECSQVLANFSSLMSSLLINQLGPLFVFYTTGRHNISLHTGLQVAYWWH